MLTLAASVLLCTLALWLMFGLCTSLLYRLLRNTFMSIDPGQASSLLLVWIAVPLSIALLTGWVMYSPDISRWLVLGHCHLGDCRQHGPQTAGAVWPVALLVVWTALRLGVCLRRHWLPALRLRRQLDRMGQAREDYVYLDSPTPAAFTIGWWKSAVFITTGMRAACSPREIECILEHERAHRRRGDNARLLAAHVLSAPLPHGWTRLMLEDLKLLCEQASDQLAATATSREEVAQALLRVARLQQTIAPAGSFAFAGEHTVRRIEVLLAGPAAVLPNERVFASLSVGALLILTVINPLHRVLEWIF
jgi:hypothetical protein